MSTVIGFILLTLLLAFTLFNIYATATKKKREEFNAQKYNALFAPLEEKIIKNSKEWKGKPTARIVTEKEAGIVAVRDDERKRAIISWDMGLKEFSFDDYIGSTIKDDESGISVTVALKDESLFLEFSNGKFKKKYITSTLREEAKNFVEFLNKMSI